MMLGKMLQISSYSMTLFQGKAGSMGGSLGVAAGAGRFGVAKGIARGVFVLKGCFNKTLFKKRFVLVLYSML